MCNWFSVKEQKRLFSYQNDKTISSKQRCVVWTLKPEARHIQESLYFTNLYFKTIFGYKTTWFGPIFGYKTAWFGPKGQFSVLNDLYFKTTCNIRPHFLGPMDGLKTEGPLYFFWKMAKISRLQQDRMSTMLVLSELLSAACSLTSLIYNTHSMTLHFGLFTSLNTQANRLTTGENI